MRRVSMILVACVIAGTGVASGLGLLGGWAWWLDLFAHFRVQYAGLLLLASLLALALGHLRWMIVAIALLVLELVWLGRAVVAEVPASDGPLLRLAHFNVLSSNDAYAAALQWLTESEAELVLWEEVSPGWAAALGRAPGYQALVMLAREDNFGLAILAREGSAVEVVSSEVVMFAGLPAVALRLRHHGRPLALLGLHTLPPMSARHAATRDAQLLAAARWSATEQAAGYVTVVLGDFNATPFSVGVAPLRTTGLRDSLTASGLLRAGSWPALPWPLRPFAIAIDHCWHDARLVTRERTVGPALGSDHRPLQVTLAWAR